MLDELKKAASNAAGAVTGAIKGTAVKAGTAIAGKIAETEWGKKKMMEELDKMPMPPQAKQMFKKLMDSENGFELLTKISKETEELIKSGKNQMSASQSVMMKYQKDLRDAMLGK